MTRIEICQVGNSAPENMLDVLPDSQGGTGRHKCLVCAYQKGIVSASQGENSSKFEQCEHGNTAPEDILSNLHESQAGAGRHKCAICAYAKGVEAGTAFSDKIIIDDWELTIKTAVHSERRSIPIKQRKAVKIDYLAREIRNRNVGLAGEQLILNYEKKRLRELNRGELSERVEHVSVTKGDGLGYDILSFTEDGEEKYIEVKTTSGNEKTPFEISDNEVEFSEEMSSKFYLYRVYNFGIADKNADFFVKQGKIRDNFELVSTNYRAYH